MSKEQHPPVNRKLNMAKPSSVVILGFYHENATLFILLISFIPVGILIGAKNQLNEVVSISLVFLSLFLISGGARHFILANLTRFLKHNLVDSFRIIYFRSFHEDQSVKARDIIAPILGCAGHLTTIHNKNYIQGLTKVEGHDHSDDLWFAWLEIGEILSNGLDTIKCEGDKWKQEVRRLLNTADLVVIDISVNSENIEWERNLAHELLPEDRIILLQSTGTEIKEDLNLIEFELSNKGRNKFRREIKEKLTAIKSTESKVFSA